MWYGAANVIGRSVCKAGRRALVETHKIQQHLGLIFDLAVQPVQQSSELMSRTMSSTCLLPQCLEPQSTCTLLEHCTLTDALT